LSTELRALSVFPRARGKITLKGVKQRALILALAGLAACTASQRSAWHQSGRSWGESGKQTARALGESINPDATNRKEEWKQLGRDLSEAGKDTGRALGKSLTPPDDPPETKRP
jgi:hypothetical protein